jgi:hypothetical protein
MIREELERSPSRKAVLIELRPGLVRTDLARYLLETRPSVVHFSGHGDKDAVYAEDPAGRSSPIAVNALRDLFAMPLISETVRLVVLSSCLSHAQASGIARSIPAVIGMRGSILDDAALAFSRGLYMALGQGLSISDAFAFGKNAIMLEGIPQERVPVLVTQRGQSAMRLYAFSPSGGIA